MADSGIPLKPGKASVASLQKELESLKYEMASNFRETKKQVSEVVGRASKLEVRLDKLERKVESIVDQLNDLKRQSCKVCVVLSGDDLPKPTEGENPTKIFCDSVKNKYGVRIDEKADLITVHRRFRGSLIAKFGKTGPGSNFNRLAHRRGQGCRNPHPELRIYANILLTPFDEKIRYYASLAKKCNVIYFYETLPSGRIGVLIDDANKPGEKKMLQITTAKDVKILLTDEVIRLIKDRPGKKKENRGETTEDHDDVEMDENVLLGSEPMDA